MPKDLRSFLRDLTAGAPADLVTIDREIDPKFEITALQRHLEREGRSPTLLFKNVRNLRGEPSGFRLVTNVFADRRKCAVALDLPRNQWRMETSFEFARRARERVKPVVVSREEAPVKEVVKVGKEANLFDLPVVTHHEMDGHPYLVDAIIAADPDTGVYNSSHHRMLVKDHDKLGLWMSPRHLWDYFRRAEEWGEPLPIAHVLGHHPGFYLASEAICPMADDELEVIGGVLGEPLRLVPSEAFGSRLMVPAEAEIVVEAEVLPGVREPEGPFGEFTGYYGPQRWSPVAKVRAITHRRDAMYLNILVGHADTSILGGIPKEAGIYEEIRRAVPNVRAVHFPISGCCRFHAYISIDKKVDGQGVVAGMAAFPHHDELKHVVVVDSDVDAFNEADVMERIRPEEWLKEGDKR